MQKRSYELAYKKPCYADRIRQISFDCVYLEDVVYANPDYRRFTWQIYYGNSPQSLDGRISNLLQEWNTDSAGLVKMHKDDPSVRRDTSAGKIFTV